MDGRGDGSRDGRQRAGALPAAVPRPVDRHAARSRRARRSSPSRATAATATTSSTAALEGRRRARRGRRATGAARLPTDAPLAGRARRARRLARSGARGARALARRRSSPSPARSARPRPRRRCGSRCRATARPMPRSPPTTITGACRCRWRAARRARYAVFEIGMNHAGEITPLTRLVRPHVAIVTTVAPVHLEYLRLGRRDRRRQGGDLSRPRARRRRGPQPRQPQFAPSRARRAGRRASRIVSLRRAREARCAADRLRAASRMLDRAGRHSRRTTSPTSSARPAAIWC